MARLASAVIAGMVLVAAAAPLAGEPTLTGKERLGPKSSDQQRVDDCKVPPALRDRDLPRPAGCATPAAGAKSMPVPAASPD